MIYLIFMSFPLRFYPKSRKQFLGLRPRRRRPCPWIWIPSQWRPAVSWPLEPSWGSREERRWPRRPWAARRSARPRRRRRSPWRRRFWSPAWRGLWSRQRREGRRGCTTGTWDSDRVWRAESSRSSWPWPWSCPSSPVAFHYSLVYWSARLTTGISFSLSTLLECPFSAFNDMSFIDRRQQNFWLKNQ